MTGLRSWLASSWVESPEGGFVAWYDADAGEQAFPYPEISGYALTYFAGLSDLSDLEAARVDRAAAWLVERVGSGRTAPERAGGEPEEYVFDLGMISTGLQSYGGSAGRPDLVDAGADIAARVAVRLVEGIEREGRPCAFLRPGVVPRRTTWSTTGAAHLGKVVQCLLLAAENGLDRAQDAAARLAATTAHGLRDAGWFETEPDGTVMLHPHWYAVEGLWMYAEATGDPETMASARRGAVWAWGQRGSDGLTPRFVGVGENEGTVGPVQLDATAQAIRGAALFGLEGVVDAAERLAATAVRIGENSAIPYQSDGPAARHLNTWASMFAAQALAAATGARPTWRTLV